MEMAAYGCFIIKRWWIYFIKFRRTQLLSIKGGKDL